MVLRLLHHCVVHHDSALLGLYMSVCACGRARARPAARPLCNALALRTWVWGEGGCREGDVEAKGRKIGQMASCLVISTESMASPALLVRRSVRRSVRVDTQARVQQGCVPPPSVWFSSLTHGRRRQSRTSRQDLASARSFLPPARSFPWRIISISEQVRHEQHRLWQTWTHPC